ncbi:glycosyltransferase [Thermus phage TMA]|uniref:glycosyltransferase n=1 Tax=Thermus phage TMA TaxID=699370 RepID=UPI0000E689E8|nr:glycosyltransferase [Thermus phage TMA]YP_874127.1 glycosyltransferase [Thermus phage phiYS40]ABJ91508.1 glycosyltransferase [Thermus phage phiYS40]BAK53632.1 glycosyltransferase [Thermus phage phiYS40]BAK53799.1 glycosyltransferase [Thermus phage TMA]
MQKLLWDSISEIEMMSVKCHAYIIDDGGEIESFRIFDEFSKRIVKDKSFEKLYELLKEGEDFYLYLVEDLNGDERFFIRTYLEGMYLLHPDYVKEVKACVSYADYIVSEMNQYFRNVLKEIVSKNTKKIKMLLGIERRHKISEIYTQYATFETELLLAIKGVF